MQVFRVTGPRALYEEDPSWRLAVGRTRQSTLGQHAVEILRGNDVRQLATESLQLLEIVGFGSRRLHNGADPHRPGAVGRVQFDIELSRLPVDLGDFRGGVNFDAVVSAKLFDQFRQRVGLGAIVGRDLRGDGRLTREVSAEFSRLLDKHHIVTAAGRGARRRQAGQTASDDEYGGVDLFVERLGDADLPQLRQTHAQVVIREHLGVFLVLGMTPDDQFAHCGALDGDLVAETELLDLRSL